MQKIDQRVYYYPVQEVWNTEKTKQEVFTDIKSVSKGLPFFESVDEKNLIFTTPIVTPIKLRNSLLGNPNNLLFDIKEFSEWQNQKQVILDETLLPILFPKGEKQYIGLIKRGYAKDYLSLAYDPSLLPPLKKAFLIEYIRWSLEKGFVFDTIKYYFHAIDLDGVKLTFINRFISGESREGYPIFYSALSSMKTTFTPTKSDSNFYVGFNYTWTGFAFGDSSFIGYIELEVRNEHNDCLLKQVLKIK